MTEAARPIDDIMAADRVRRRVFLEWLLVAGLALATMLLLAGSGAADRADNLLYDALMARRPAAASPVVIVAIDEPSLQTLGRWPWPRRTHAALLRRLAAARPAAIGYDVLFVEPSDDDPDLAAALAQAGRVVLPMAFLLPGSNGAPFDADVPAPPLAAAARAVGHVDVAHDRDGIVRRVSLRGGSVSANWPAFAEQLHRIVRGRPSAAAARTTTEPLPAGRFALARPVLVPFAGPAGTHRQVSLADVLAGRVPPELLAGRVLLVGSTASGSGDQYPTPVGAMPGVEIQANMLDSLLRGEVILPMGRAASALATLLPLAVLLAGLLLLPPRLNVALGLGLIAGLLAASALLLRWAGLWLPPAAGLAGLALVYPLWGWRRLEAANAYMVRELTRLRAEPAAGLPDATPPVRRGWAGEAIAHQTDLLHLAIERVRSLRRFFADSLADLPDATLVLDLAGRVLVANKAAVGLFGDLAPATRLTDLIDRLAPGEAAGELDGRELVTLSGRVLVVRLVPLHDARDVAVGSIARLSDITALRLAARQRENTLQLLSHDMRSPQASILALLRHWPPSDAAVRDQIAGYAQRTLSLADGFVQLARAESAPTRFDLLDLVPLLDEAVDDQWVLAHAKGITLAVERGPEECLVCGDRALLGRMLVNLVGNAVKYSGAGTAVTCVLAIEPEAAVCRIADQGRGIAADDLPFIFKPFHRVVARGEEAVGGAGLGLAFVETVATRHGGSVSCVSQPGVGSTFTVRLPRPA